MDTYWAIILTLALSIVVLGGILSVGNYAYIMSERLATYSHINTIALLLTQNADFPITPTISNNTLYMIEYSSTTATLSPRIIAHGDHIKLQLPNDEEERPYNVVWYEVWEQTKNTGEFIGLLIMTPYVWTRPTSP